MPDQRAPEYKEADRRTGPDQMSAQRARVGVTGIMSAMSPGLGLVAVIIALVIVYLIYFHR
jgi:hypothetical protein